MKRGKLWHGLLILAVLGGVAVMTDQADGAHVIVLVWLVAPAFVSAAAASWLSARFAGRHVIPVTRVATMAVSSLTGGAAAVLGARLLDREPSWAMFWGCGGIHLAAGWAAGHFAAMRAVYLQARRSGLSDAEAKAASAWDPERFGLG